MCLLNIYIVILHIQPPLIGHLCETTTETTWMLLTDNMNNLLWCTSATLHNKYCLVSPLKLSYLYHWIEEPLFSCQQAQSSTARGCLFVLYNSAFLLRLVECRWTQSRVLSHQTTKMYSSYILLGFGFPFFLAIFRASSPLRLHNARFASWCSKQ